MGSELIHLPQDDRAAIRANPLKAFLAMAEALKWVKLSEAEREKLLDEILRTIQRYLHSDSWSGAEKDRDAFEIVSAARDALEDPIAARLAARLLATDRQDARDRAEGLTTALRFKEEQLQAARLELQAAQEQLRLARAKASEVVQSGAHLGRLFFEAGRAQIDLTRGTENPLISDIDSVQSVVCLYVGVELARTDRRSVRIDLLERRFKGTDVLRTPYIFGNSEEFRAALKFRLEPRPEEEELLREMIDFYRTRITLFLRHWVEFSEIAIFPVRIPLSAGRCVFPWAPEVQHRVYGSFDPSDRDSNDATDVAIASDPEIPIGSAAHLDHVSPFLFRGGALLTSPIVRIDVDPIGSTPEDESRNRYLDLVDGTDDSKYPMPAPLSESAIGVVLHNLREDLGEGAVPLRYWILRIEK